MKLSKRLLHFMFSLRCSIVSVIIGITMIVVVVLLLSMTNKDSLSLSFVVGIIASVIATLLFKITDKYSNSISAFSSVLFKVNMMISFFDETININNYTSQSIREDLLKYYFSICENYDAITYKKDYNMISKTVKELIDICNCNYSYKSVLNEKNKLVFLIEDF